jgi:hypothetical protein
MANAEDLKKLKEGFAAWNKWRDGTKLFDADLSGANLRRALFVSDLSYAELDNPSFSEAAPRSSGQRQRGHRRQSRP